MCVPGPDRGCLHELPPRTAVTCIEMGTFTLHVLKFANFSVIYTNGIHASELCDPVRLSAANQHEMGRCGVTHNQWTLRVTKSTRLVQFVRCQRNFTGVGSDYTKTRSSVMPSAGFVMWSAVQYKCRSGALALYSPFLSLPLFRQIWCRRWTRATHGVTPVVLYTNEEAQCDELTLHSLRSTCSGGEICASPEFETQFQRKVSLFRRCPKDVGSERCRVAFVITSSIRLTVSIRYRLVADGRVGYMTIEYMHRASVASCR